MPDDKLTYKRVGDKAIEISWPDNVQDILINRHNVALAIEEHFKNEVLVNEGYRTILLLFKDEIKNPDQQIQEFDIGNIFEGKSKLDRRHDSRSKVVDTPNTILYNNKNSTHLEHRTFQPGLSPTLQHVK